MWKIFLIGTVCIPWVCGQCLDSLSCHGQTLLPTNTEKQQQKHQQQKNVTPTYYTTDTQNLSSLMPLHLYPTDSLSFIGSETTEDYYASSHNGTKKPTILTPSSTTIIPSEAFSSRLFQLMSESTSNQSLLISPMSLQTLLTFIYTISEGKLSQELATLLELPHNSSYLVRKYESLLKSPYNSNQNNTLIVANKLYYEQRFGYLQPSLRQLAGRFASDIDAIDFLAPQQASDSINSWIAGKTRNLIQGIVSPESLRADTRAILINSLYFKSEWLQKFSPYDTDTSPFFIEREKNVLVNTMYIEDVFPYGEFDELNAKVVELPYILDDFRMMIILPNEIDGLQNVEKRLSSFSLKSIGDRLNNAEVTIRLPQFKIEFESELVPTLQQMGLYSLFNEDAQLKLFKNQVKPIRVDQIKQKTFISVNEAGTEAAAVTFAKFVPLSIPLRVKQFKVDHPFIFVIRNSKALYFMGHVKQL